LLALEPLDGDEVARLQIDIELDCSLEDRRDVLVRAPIRSQKRRPSRWKRRRRLLTF
jgi:hypothetical protein